MRQVKISKPQLIFTALLLIVIAGLAIAVANGSRLREPLEITLDTASTFERQVYVDGAVANPGYYPAAADTTLDEIIKAAGGISDDAASPEVTVSVTSGVTSAQQVDLNHAGAWLLQALPGIGEVRAQAIIDHRETHGPFANTRGLLDVPGISLGIYEGLREYVSVKD